MIVIENNKLLSMYSNVFCVFVSIIIVAICCCQSTLGANQNYLDSFDTNNNECSYDIVVTIPASLTYTKELKQDFAKTHEILLELINNAQKTIYITTYELTLLKESTKHVYHETEEPGEQIVTALCEAAKRGVEVIILHGLKGAFSDIEKDRLESAGIKIKYLDVESILGSGIQHSKLLITDERDLYLGSANWNWQSYTQVKELGIVYRNCRLLAEDLQKIFKTWEMIADTGFKPANLPENFITNFNKSNPMKLKMDNITSEVYFATSPKPFDGINNHRSEDIESVLNTINKAEKFISISVMNYNPLYQRNRKEYWPVIEDALKDAMLNRNVIVKLLVSIRPGRKINERQLNVLKSLDKFRLEKPSGGGSFEVKIFIVPAYDEFQSKLQFSRVKHDKYIVTDNSVYIGTSNWSADYFDNTCGVGISIRPDPIELKESDNNIIIKMKEIYDRDYESEYTNYASNF